MNLEPILAVAVGPPFVAKVGAAPYNNDDDKGEEMDKNCGSINEAAAAEAKKMRIDAQTRFLCRMLDDLYRTGIWREADRPTYGRCHRAIVSC